MSTPSAVAVPTPSPTPSAEDELREHCLAPGGWRIFSLERWRNQTVRAWAAIWPVVATGPTDPAIPFVAVIASGVPALGYCAPVVGAQRPAPDAFVTIWRLSEDGTSAETLALERVLPPHRTPLGALYDPPVPSPGASEGADAGRGWPPGRYVFDIGGRWFGAEVRLVGTTPAGSLPSSLP